MILTNLKRALQQPRNDKKLHFSQHLQHDRHTAVYARYGYPHTDQPWGRIFPLIQGTGVHETLHATMAGLYEKYVPEWPVEAKYGFEFDWVGTADAYVQDGDTNWLLDYKTISGPGMMFLGDEPKPEHILQVSAYYHFGPKQNVRTAVIYFPTSPDYKKQWDEPVMLEFEPLAKEVIMARMLEVEEYIFDYERHDELPDPPAGEYVWKRKGTKSWTYQYDLLYKPHYTTMFCPWAGMTDDPCGCSLDTKKTIATWVDGVLTNDPEYDIIVKEIGEPEDAPKTKSKIRSEETETGD